MTQLAAGDEFTVVPGRVRMGIGWDKDRGAGVARTGRPEVDLDATALQFAGGQLFDLAFYNNLKTRDGSVEHLGDNTTGSGEGDDEAITVDLGPPGARHPGAAVLVPADAHPHPARHDGELVTRGQLGHQSTLSISSGVGVCAAPASMS